MEFQHLQRLLQHEHDSYCKTIRNSQERYRIRVIKTGLQETKAFTYYTLSVVYMDILKKVTISVLAGFMLTGCYSKFDLDGESEPVLCLNSILIPGDSIRLQVTRTWEWRENDLLDYQNVDVTDAEVSLYINGRLMEKMTPRTYYCLYYTEPTQRDGDK